MRAFFTFPLLLVALVLTGCSPVATTPNFPAVENFVGDAPAVERVAGFAEAVEKSYRLLYEVGMREEVISAGDEYILSYAPQENFYAGLYNPEVEGVILIEDEDYFTVASAHLALQDPATLVIETANGLSLSHPSFGNFTIVIEGDLVVSGFDNDGEWTGVFIYEPDAKVTAMVVEELAKTDQ